MLGRKSKRINGYSKRQIAQTILDTVFKEGLFKEKPNVQS